MSPPAASAAVLLGNPIVPPPACCVLNLFQLCHVPLPVLCEFRPIKVIWHTYSQIPTYVVFINCSVASVYYHP